MLDVSILLSSYKFAAEEDKVGATLVLVEGISLGKDIKKAIFVSRPLFGGTERP